MRMASTIPVLVGLFVLGWAPARAVEEPAIGNFAGEQLPDVAKGKTLFLLCTGSSQMEGRNQHNQIAPPLPGDAAAHSRLFVWRNQKWSTAPGPSGQLVGPADLVARELADRMPDAYIALVNQSFGGGSRGAGVEAVSEGGDSYAQLFGGQGSGVQAARQAIEAGFGRWIGLVFCGTAPTSDGDAARQQVVRMVADWRKGMGNDNVPVVLVPSPHSYPESIARVHQVSPCAACINVDFLNTYWTWDDASGTYSQPNHHYSRESARVIGQRAAEALILLNRSKPVPRFAPPAWTAVPAGHALLPGGGPLAADPATALLYAVRHSNGSGEIAQLRHQSPDARSPDPLRTSVVVVPEAWTNRVGDQPFSAPLALTVFRDMLIGVAGDRLTLWPADRLRMDQNTRKLVPGEGPSRAITIPGASNLVAIAGVSRTLFLGDANGHIFVLDEFAVTKENAGEPVLKTAQGPRDLIDLAIRDRELFALSRTARDIFRIDPTGRGPPIPLGLAAMLKDPVAMAATDDGKWLVSDAGANAVWICDPKDGTARALVTLADPGRMAFDAQRRLLVIAQPHQERLSVFHLCWTNAPPQPAPETVESCFAVAATTGIVAIVDARVERTSTPLTPQTIPPPYRDALLWTEYEIKGVIQGSLQRETRLLTVVQSMKDLKMRPPAFFKRGEYFRLKLMDRETQRGKLDFPEADNILNYSEKAYFIIEAEPIVP